MAAGASSSSSAVAGGADVAGVAPNYNDSALVTAATCHRQVVLPVRSLLGFTGTKVQILTPEELRASTTRRSRCVRDSSSAPWKRASQQRRLKAHATALTRFRGSCSQLCRERLRAKAAVRRQPPCRRRCGNCFPTHTCAASAGSGLWITSRVPISAGVCVWCSRCLIYWYKSTHTDSKASCTHLRSHHGEKRGAAQISNACPKCAWFSPQVTDWPPWDGRVWSDQEDEDGDASSRPKMSQLDAVTQEKCKGGSGSGSISSSGRAAGTVPPRAEKRRKLDTPRKEG
jgi:hypothetical protein